MTPTLCEKPMARNDSLMTGPARARRRLTLAALTGALALALAIPAPRASQPGAAVQATHASATTSLSGGGSTASSLPIPPIETGCCA